MEQADPKQDSLGQTSKSDAFVSSILKKMESSTACGAALRRADNQATEYQAWEYLATWCDIEKPWERLRYAVVSAALARAKPARDGVLPLGEALARCYENGTRDAAWAKLRRLLACDSIEEVCAILRPLLSLIISRGCRISFARLLDDLSFFPTHGERIKARWASQFFHTEGE